MARVSISWDGQTPVEYDGDRDAMQYLQQGLDELVRLKGLAIVSKGAGELQYAVEQGEDQDESYKEHLSELNEQIDLEDIINEGKDNGC